MKSLLRYREQIRNQLVKDKPSSQDVQEQIREEETLSSKVMNSHKMRKKFARLRNSKLRAQKCSRAGELLSVMNKPAQLQTKAVKNRKKAADKSKLEGQQKQFPRRRETSWKWSKAGEQAQ
ncbi:TMV resistance protein N-like [Dorcoceras hygrometricum]|uniref:TMV resistance protein N-like n=1 Tax=Dorcoceras hygrometricum TaxID=472368 RepID=A0A2Z7AYB0_9LAMI|nr:TMV resistance protein N-like [Dorcoceras hygrometricum]